MFGKRAGGGRVEKEKRFMNVLCLEPESSRSSTELLIEIS